MTGKPWEAMYRAVTGRLLVIADSDDDDQTLLVDFKRVAHAHVGLLEDDEPFDSRAWVAWGIAVGFSSEGFCWTHDHAALTDTERERFDEGDDPCVPAVRVYVAVSGAVGADSPVSGAVGADKRAVQADNAVSGVVQADSPIPGAVRADNG